MPGRILEARRHCYIEVFLGVAVVVVAVGIVLVAAAVVVAAVVVDVVAINM